MQRPTVGRLLSVIQSLHIIYASTSGHTEFVVGVLTDFLKKKVSNLQVEVQRCEEATPEDLLKGDVLLLGSGTWNTGGIEGQLNPYLHQFLKKDAKDVDLQGKNVASIALGDERYYYTSRAGEHLRNFIQSHNGKVLGQPLTIVNDPYGQEEKIEKWGEKLVGWMKELGTNC
jgi:flavodoxin I